MFLSSFKTLSEPLFCPVRSSSREFDRGPFNLLTYAAAFSFGFLAFGSAGGKSGA